MNHIPHGDASACATAGPVPFPSCASLLLLPPRILVTTVYSVVDVVKKTFDGAYPEPCNLCHGKHPAGARCCDIPETDCPDPCVAVIHWTGCVDDSFSYRIQVTNSSDRERDFALVAAPFPCTEQTPKVVPAAKTLAAGESFQAVVSFTIPEAFAGSTYHTVIRVRGAYEQVITVKLAVKPAQDCCCHIEQGDVPKRVKAHHWLNHFQCETACFPGVVKE